MQTGLFSLRDCWPLGFENEFVSVVEHKYSSGFDVIFSDSIVYLTDQIDLLNPLGILVPSNVVSHSGTGDRVVFSRKTLNISGSKLHQTDTIKSKSHPQGFDYEILRGNLLSIHSNIKLFGRPSVVKELIMGCNTEQNILSGSEKILLEPDIDLYKVMDLIGVGEGLTPAFDDMLTGILLANRFFSSCQIVIPDGFFDAIKSRTTRQSVQQLCFANSGFLNVGFENLLGDLGRTRVKSAQIVRLLNRGNSSGTDILCGVWHYLSKQVMIQK